MNLNQLLNQLGLMQQYWSIYAFIFLFFSSLGFIYGQNTNILKTNNQFSDYVKTPIKLREPWKVIIPMALFINFFAFISLGILLDIDKFFTNRSALGFLSFLSIFAGFLLAKYTNKTT